MVLQEEGKNIPDFGTFLSDISESESASVYLHMKHFAVEDTGFKCMVTIFAHF